MLIALAGISVLAALLLYLTIDPSKSALFPKCPFLMFTGFYCPGCGSQRAIHHLLNGEIISGLQYNLLIVLLIAVLSYIFIRQGMQLVFKFQSKNILHYPVITQSVLIVVILFWILRNITVYPFSLLAP
ncbi:MAG: DUF2752 domain-containing protein [Bacteroidia bacterium]|nr:DUF2752 domain-containing protein [Bacteroidia bacterium]MBT8287757.1 DUF2752 domain-containing protein [Bacteroidia bacterium]NNK71881.1 DUF2752 domain-containing protein [Flavobacteriaceae bacterium]